MHGDARRLVDDQQVRVAVQNGEGKRVHARFIGRFSGQQLIIPNRRRYLPHGAP
jgi:hypothetical protein